MNYTRRPSVAGTDARVIHSFIRSSDLESRIVSNNHLHTNMLSCSYKQAFRWPIRPAELCSKPTVGGQCMDKKAWMPAFSLSLLLNMNMNMTCVH